MPYNPRKAAQTIAFFALRSGNSSVSVLKAVKLVYLADRESVRRRGHPIQDEARVSMPHGPVNSMTYDHLGGAYELDAVGWSDFLAAKANHEVSLSSEHISEIDLDELSQSELEILGDVWSQFGHMNQWALRDWTHVNENVPEWKDPNGSSRPISLGDMMKAVGLSDTARREAEYKSLMQEHDVFASL